MCVLIVLIIAILIIIIYYGIKINNFLNEPCEKNDIKPQSPTQKKAGPQKALSMPIICDEAIVSTYGGNAGACKWRLIKDGIEIENNHEYQYKGNVWDSHWQCKNYEFSSQFGDYIGINVKASDMIHIICSPYMNAIHGQMVASKIDINGKNIGRYGNRTWDFLISAQISCFELHIENIDRLITLPLYLPYIDFGKKLKIVNIKNCNGLMDENGWFIGPQIDWIYTNSTIPVYNKYTKKIYFGMQSFNSFDAFLNEITIDKILSNQFKKKLKEFEQKIKSFNLN